MVVGAGLGLIFGAIFVDSLLILIAGLAVAFVGARQMMLRSYD